VVAAGGGFVLLTVWLENGGVAQREPGRIRPPLILSHFLLAATGLVLWIIYVATDSEALAWIAFVALVIVGAVGFTMFALWMRQAATPGSTAGTGGVVAATAGEPAEQRFPVSIVGLHGLLAVTTVVLVFLATIGVGD
jgi:Na+/proline symporter